MTCSRQFRLHVEARAKKQPSEKSEAQPWEKPIFGVPMAPTEIWEGFAQEHRCFSHWLRVLFMDKRALEQPVVM